MAHTSISLWIENCIRELILNSLRAEATAIAVRIDTQKQRIQVIDNGEGIGKNDLSYVGEESINKNDENFLSMEKINRMRGNSLMNIRKFSSGLIIMSRGRYSLNTYGKYFSSEKIPVLKKIENRPSCGTTVTLYAPSDGFEGKFTIDASRIRYLIAYLALVNEQASFSVRDDTSQSILLRIGKNQKHSQLLKVICKRKSARNDVHRVKTLIFKKLKIQIFWGVDWTDSRKIQQIFLNLRSVRCPTLKNSMIKIIRKSNDEISSSRKVFFMLYIESPETEYKLSMENDRSIVEFHEIGKIVDSIEKFVTNFLRTSNSSKLIASKRINPRMTIRPCGRILGAKPKRSFLTKASRSSFEYLRNLKREIAELKVRSEIKKSRISGNEDRAVINYDTDDYFLRSKYQNSHNRVSVEECRLHNIINVSQISQRCLEKSQKYFIQSLTKTQNENQYKTVPTTNCDHDFSQMDKKCREKSQKSSPELSKILQSQNCNNTLLMRNKNYDNYNISWINQECIRKSQQKMETTHIEESPKIMDEYIAINECSQWSDWIYEAELKNDETRDTMKPIIYQRFKFLPPHLHALLPRGNVKLISRDSLENNMIPLKLNNNRRQDIDVRSCTKLHFEFRLKLESLKSMKVLNQVNREFIVALTRQDDKKLLVIIDQHAMHERIRYEDILRAYKRNAKNQQFLSVVLHRPIVISDLSPRCCDLLQINRDLLMQYGLSLDRRDETTLTILSVPRCFLKKTFYTNNMILEVAVRKLLREILENLNNDGIKKILPFTIHEAIASEACHGAIKFGDPLTLEQCDSLVSCWKETDAPNRCAHGRPSVVPLLELETYQRNKDELSCREKLNFVSLLKPRNCVRTMDETLWTRLEQR